MCVLCSYNAVGERGGDKRSYLHIRWSTPFRRMLILLVSLQAWCPAGKGGGGRVGVYSLLPETFNLFMTKNLWFSLPYQKPMTIYDLKSSFLVKKIPSLRVVCKNHTPFFTKMATTNTLWPKWMKPLPFRATHTYVAHIREYPLITFFLVATWLLNTVVANSKKLVVIMTHTHTQFLPITVPDRLNCS